MHQRGGDTGGGLVAGALVLPPGRRVLALVALLCLGGALAVLIWGGMRSAPELLLAIGVLGVGAGGAGYAVVRAGHRRRFGIGLAVFAVVACVVLVYDAGLPSIRSTGRLIAFALLVAGYVVSSRAALRRTQRVSDLVRRQHRPRRPVLLLNPGSGQESSTVRVREAARRIGVPVVELGVDGEDLTAMATTAIAGGADCLAIAGGDGSISAVAAVAVEHDVPVLVVPAGTRNHFALDLGLDVRRPERAVRAVRRGSLSRVDLGSVNGRTFVNNVGLGAYAHVVHHEHYRLDRWGTALEALPEVMSPEGERANFSFVDHEGARHDGADVLLVSNNPYELRSMRGFGHRPSLASGRLGIVSLAMDSGTSVAAAIALAMTGNPDLHHGYREWSVPEFEVLADGPVEAGVDGEAVELEAPLRFVSQARALQVLLPPGTRTRRRRTAGSVRDLATLIRGGSVTH